MIILEDKFRLTHNDRGSFDCEILTGSKGKEAYKIIANTCDLKTCFKKLLLFKISKKHTNINQLSKQLQEYLNIEITIYKNLYNVFYKDLHDYCNSIDELILEKNKKERLLIKEEKDKIKKLKKEEKNGNSGT